MKITIGGSMCFAKEQLEVKRKLEEMGHMVLISEDTEHYADSPETKLSFDEELRLCIEQDIMRKFYNMIAESDALLICNYPKRGIEGYLGTSVLIELGLAYYLKKKTYLLYPVDRNQGYALEVAVFQPQILEGDLGKIR